MRIRPMRAGDEKKLALLEEKCFALPWRDTFLKEMYDSAYDFVEVAEYEGELIAYINIRILAKEAELMRIAVEKKYRKRGLASLLLQRALNLCREKNVQSIFLEVRESNIEAISLYRKYDFEECGLRKDYYSMPLESALIMRYKIC